jgi:hypothetical protein
MPGIYNTLFFSSPETGNDKFFRNFYLIATHKKCQFGFQLDAQNLCQVWRGAKILAYILK